MPGSFIPLGAASGANAIRFRDPGCANIDNAFVGTTGAPPSVTPFCGWQYTQFDNITELEDRYQIYTQLDVALTDVLLTCPRRCRSRPCQAAMRGRGRALHGRVTPREAHRWPAGVSDETCAHVA